MFSAAVVAAALAATSVTGSPLLETRQSTNGTRSLSSPGALGFDYPPIRGWSLETAEVAPCGGYTLGGRTNYPLTGGDISLVMQRDGLNVSLMYSTDANPTEMAQFQPVSHNITQLFGGSACLSAPDFAAQGLSAGDPVTFLITYAAGPRNAQFYQCVDVTLVEATAFTPIMEYECKNVTLSTTTKSGQNTAAVSSDGASATDSSSGAAATANSATGSEGSSNKISNAAAGGIGAGVTLAVIGAVLAALAFTGFMSFGKKSKTSAFETAQYHERDGASTLHSVNSTGSVEPKRV